MKRYTDDVLGVPAPVIGAGPAVRVGILRRLAATSTLTVALMTVACSGGGGTASKPTAVPAAPASEPTAVPAAPASEPTVVPAAPASEPVAAAPKPDDVAGSIQVAASELKFEPNTISARPGLVNFVVQNVGMIEHNFIVEDGARKEIAKIANIEVGKTEQLSSNLQAGTYMVVCTLPGHREAGMVGTVNVSQ